jgi:hypothetical protein
VSASRQGFDAEVAATFKADETVEREVTLRPVEEKKSTK